jgi:hypothetical protein
MSRPSPPFGTAPEKHRLGFLDLPGEIRNPIYMLLFQRTDYELRWLSEPRNTPNRFRSLTYWEYNLPRDWLDETRAWADIKVGESTGWDLVFSGPKFHGCGERALERRRNLFKEWRLRNYRAPMGTAPSRAALLQTCRQINVEATPFLYSEASFGFADTGLPHRFLSCLRPPTKRWINKIYLQHQTYKEGFWRQGTPGALKMKVHDSWMSTCRRVANRQELPNLKEVFMHFTVNEEPLCLEVESAWVQPLLLLKGNVPLMNPILLG